LRIAPWLLATFAPIWMFGLRAVVLYDFSRPCTWIAGLWGRPAESSAATDRISIAVGPAG
jgi:hypothetical protein